MVYDPVRVPEPAGRAHWPLDANVDVVMVADTVSQNLNDLKVSTTQCLDLADITCPIIS